MAAVLKNIRAAYANLRTYIPESIKTFRQDTGKELSLKNYLEVHARASPSACSATAPGRSGRPPRVWRLSRLIQTWLFLALP